MTAEDIVKFVKENEMLKVSVLEKKAGIPSRSLFNAIKNGTSLKDEYVRKLVEILKPMGLQSNKDKTNIISILNNKGGVGKTTLSVNLGCGLARLGAKVLIIDIDPQGNASQHIGYDLQYEEEELKDCLVNKSSYKDVVRSYKHNENVKILPTSLNLETAVSEIEAMNVRKYYALDDLINKIDEKFDYILIDCLPSLSSIFILNALMASNKVLIPMHTDRFNATGFKNIIKSVKDVKQLNPALDILGIVITLTENTALHKSFLASLQSSNFKVFDTMIRKNVAIKEAQNERVDVYTYNDEYKKTRNKSRDYNGALDYMELSKEIKDYVEKV